MTPSDVYYGYQIYGFQFWYIVGTPQAVFDIFERDLAFIIDKLPYSVIDELKRKVPIYLTMPSPVPSNYPTTHSMVQYTRQLGQGYGAIEVFNYDDFIRANQNDQPSIVLHAIAKAVYNVVVDFSTQLEIDYTFQEVYRSGKYQNVQSYWGQMGPHYCLADAGTYFAECTEAYFSMQYIGFQYRNDYYPAVQNSLMVRIYKFHSTQPNFRTLTTTVIALFVTFLGKPVPHNSSAKDEYNKKLSISIFSIVNSKKVKTSRRVK